MDFMFEDEVDEVGSDVEAYCPKCKADTTHVVISKYEDEIRRVQCNPCGDVHSFRKPRGEVEDDVPEPIAAKKRAMLKKPTWDEYFAKHGEKQGKPYEFREQYNENAIVTHPKFGRGFVSEVMSDSKVEITFKDARRVLVHNRKDMPGLPLAAEGDGIPSKGPKAKAAKSKAAKEEKPAVVVAKVLAPPAPVDANIKRPSGKQDPKSVASPVAKVAPKVEQKVVQKGDVKTVAKADPKSAAKSPAKIPSKIPGKVPPKAIAKPTNKLAVAAKSPAKPAGKAAPTRHAQKKAAGGHKKRH
jgi:hypothetical protein